MPFLMRALRGIRSKLGAWIARNGMNLYISTFLFILLIALLAPKIFVEVPAGFVGVWWQRLGGGTVVDRHFDEGLHIIPPWDNVILYDVRLKNDAWTYDAISSNGLAMGVEVAIRYHINKDTVGILHKMVGPDYQQVLISPEIGSAARELISRYTPEQIYAGARSFIQAQIMERMIYNFSTSVAGQSVAGSLISIEDVLIRSVTLPDSVKAAIEHKTQQYHVMLEYDYRLQREAKEAKRKEIEAQGIHAFQDIVSKGITDDYLRLRGIEATNSLAQSPNSKVVIVGSGKDGLPIILGGLDDAGNAAAPGPRAAKAAKTGHEPPSANAGEFPANDNARFDETPRSAAAKPAAAKAAAKPDTEQKAAEQPQPDPKAPPPAGQSKAP